MITPHSISEQILFTTVRIEARLGPSSKRFGTGFLYNHGLHDGRELPLVVTNRHVVEGAENGSFSLHEANSDDCTLPSGRSVSVELGDFDQLWFHHPIPTVDLSVMLLQPVVNECECKGKHIFKKHFCKDDIPTQDYQHQLTAVEDVLMVGYPNALWDTTNNLPIVRRGITASHPAINFCGENQFVIDAACFPGSSGSPVVLFNSGAFRTRDSGFVVGDRIKLLGVLWGGPQLDAEGIIVAKPIPTEFVPVPQTKLNIHLGYVIKADEIAVIASAFEEQLKSQNHI